MASEKRWELARRPSCPGFMLGCEGGVSVIFWAKATLPTIIHECDVSSQHQTASSQRFPLLREPLAVVDRVAGPDASKSRFCSGHPASRSGSMITLRMRLKVQGPRPPGPRCLHPPLWSKNCRICSRFLSFASWGSSHPSQLPRQSQNCVCE